MPECGPVPDIDVWIAVVRSHFVDFASELLGLFDTYAAEAEFGRRFIDSDLDRLPPGAKVLEVGAGSLLLSCQLVREGFDVTALEPAGTGFSHFERMKAIVIAAARRVGCCPSILDQPAEELSAVGCFDYAYSVNVMEHVHDVAAVISNVGNSLVTGGIYRFTCPNYLFPYEPHFNIPTLFSKQLTERVLRPRIVGIQNMPDPLGAWESLNWINVIDVARAVRKIQGLKLTMNRSMLVATLERVVTDREFANRRSRTVRNFILLIVRCQFHQLFRFIPAAFQPIMDCRIEKVNL
jgi:SAM-dependent methyltransferase